jgi:hypothetical protein
MRGTRVLAAVILATFAGAVACGEDDDGDEDYEASLSVAAETQGGATVSGNPTATGTADLVLEDSVLTVTVTISGQLTSNVTMAHIHGPAATTATAGIILDFVPSMTAVINAGTRTGTIVQASFDFRTLTASPTGVLRIDSNTLIGHLNSGQAYVNVHTVTNPGGEIRGQISRD